MRFVALFTVSDAVRQRLAAELADRFGDTGLPVEVVFRTTADGPSRELLEGADGAAVTTAAAAAAVQPHVAGPVVVIDPESAAVADALLDGCLRAAEQLMVSRGLRRLGARLAAWGASGDERIIAAVAAPLAIFDLD